MFVEKHKEKNNPVHMALSYLEKAFKSFPQKIFWHALRLKFF